MTTDPLSPASPLAVLIVGEGPVEPSARYEVVVATTVDEAMAALRGPMELAAVLAGLDPAGVDGARVLREARVIRPECRRVLVARGEAIAPRWADAINRCRPHHVASGWPSGGELDRLVDQLCGGMLRERRLREAAAHRDGLTGLYSHGAFQERLREEMARARRYGKPLSLLFCDTGAPADLDLGDLGDPTGDALLRGVADLLSGPELGARLRESDVAARYSGEELVILLPETSKEGAVVKAERVRAALAAAALPGLSDIRVSIGVAGFPDDAGTPADLIRCAEQARAAAVSAGRDCVRVSAGDEGGRLAIVTSGRSHPAERFTTYHVRLFDIVAGLRRDRSLACLYVDLSQLRAVERELGPTQHADLFARAGEMLDRLRGDRLRRDDLVCRTEDQDGYLCFLASPRDTSGASSLDLEAIASRVEGTLERELAAATTSLTRELPRVVVGFARVLDNPMVRPERLLVRLIAEAQRSALLHRERATQRHKALLQEIILRDMLSAVYQPIVDLASGTIFAFEGLARGPRDSTLETPTALFSVADEVDLTFELDRACFRTALAGAVGLEPVHRLFLNLLPTSFYDSSFIESEVANLLEAAALTPANLVFEITERLAIENFSSFRQALASYTRAGFGVAIDDVGTRHSNLETVMALRPNFLKLSDILTRGVFKSTVKREMVRSLQRIAETIDAVIVAEGIERQEDLAVLADLGVRYGQGYFLARPGPPFPQLRTSVRRTVRAALWMPPEETLSRAAAARLGELDDDGEVTDEVERLRVLGPAAPPAAEPGVRGRAGRPRARTSNGLAETTRSEPLDPSADRAPGDADDGRIDPSAERSAPGDAADARAGGWRPLGEELGGSGEPPLLGALQRRRATEPPDGFLEEEPTASGL